VLAVHGGLVSSESREQLVCGLHGWHLLAISFVCLRHVRIGDDIGRWLKFMHFVYKLQRWDLLL